MVAQLRALGVLVRGAAPCLASIGSLITVLFDLDFVVLPFLPPVIYVDSKSKRRL